MSDSLEKKNNSSNQRLIQVSSKHSHKARDSNNYNKNLTTPTELLMKFLTSVMTKDYEKALMYCTQILSHEPNNSTALEFYPLIVEKLEIIKREEDDSSSDSSSTTSSSSSEDMLFNKESLCKAKKSGNYERRFLEKQEGTSVGSKCNNFSSGRSINAVEKKNSKVPEFRYSNCSKLKPNSEHESRSNIDKKINHHEDLNTMANENEISSNLLIHPTKTTTLIGQRKMGLSKAKQEKEAPTALDKKLASHILLQTTPTVTFPKLSSAKTLKEVENTQ